MHTMRMTEEHDSSQIVNIGRGLMREQDCTLCLPGKPDSRASAREVRQETVQDYRYHATQAGNDRKREQKHMRLGKFSLCLNVKDLQTSRIFYETLGFEVRAGNEAEHWLLMTNGEANIGLMQGMLEKNMLTFIPNQDHDGQQLPTFTDIRDMQKQLKEAGIVFEQEAEDGTGPASFLILDPDGNPILVDQHVASSQ
ncbi:MAG TPA: VOC family protein [Ktedonobacteraceae bacterium]|nr:VOC family protein [Ktedonobacteraceae bacterium]